MGRMPLRRNWPLTRIFLPGESHGSREPDVLPQSMGSLRSQRRLSDEHWAVHFSYTPKCAWVVTSKALLCLPVSRGTALRPQAGCGHLLCPGTSSPGLAAGVWREGQVPPWEPAEWQPHSGGPRLPSAGWAGARVRGGEGRQPLPSCAQRASSGRAPASGLPPPGAAGPWEGPPAALLAAPPQPAPCAPAPPEECAPGARPPERRPAAWSALSPGRPDRLGPPARPAAAPRAHPARAAAATQAAAAPRPLPAPGPRPAAGAGLAGPRLRLRAALALRSGSRPSSRCGRGAAASTQPRRGRRGGCPCWGWGASPQPGNRALRAESRCAARGNLLGQPL